MTLEQNHALSAFLWEMKRPIDLLESKESVLSLSEELRPRTHCYVHFSIMCRYPRSTVSEEC
jgi:hypothetical protein